jgi:hypothetical protein
MTRGRAPLECVLQDWDSDMGSLLGKFGNYLKKIYL